MPLPFASHSPCRHMLIRVPVGMAVGRVCPVQEALWVAINMRYHATRRRAQVSSLASTFSAGLAGSGKFGCRGARAGADERRFVPAGSNLSGNVRGNFALSCKRFHPLPRRTARLAGTDNGFRYLRRNCSPAFWFSDCPCDACSGFLFRELAAGKISQWSSPATPARGFWQFQF